ncbi:MAG: adenylate/guanylate cyclase domain-containing protein [Parvibaculaceae bacterium]
MPTDARRLSFALLDRRLRIWTGVVLFAFAATHLMNHALGLVSLDVMEAVRDVRTAVTRSLPGTVILAGAALIHLVLGLATFINRRTLRLKPVEAVQLGFGLLIPLLLFRHVIGTRGVHELFGVRDDYEYALFAMWPWEAWQQLGLIVLVWVHGSIGIHRWLRYHSWYPTAAPWLLGAAVLIPVLAYSGFMVGARELRQSTEWTPPLSPEQFAFATTMMAWALWSYVALLAAFIAYRLARSVLGRFLPRVKVVYAGGPTVTSPPGRTLLEISRTFSIPHASVCGGRARCSTCRVRVLEGQEKQPLPGEAERRVLERVGAMGNVRLACQLRPVGELKVVTLLPANTTAADDIHQFDKYFWGVEQTVTLLFADIRGFTRLSERQLPYDVVFLLNQYLARMSESIADAGGYVDKFMGDGIMAIFGMDRTPAEGARESIVAARAMGGVLDALNQSLRNELPEPLRIGIGIHTGLAILGRIGVASGTGAGERITALGDTVNTASRLEAASKDFSAQLVISQATIDLAGASHVEAGHREEIALRGKSIPLQVVAFTRALDLELKSGGIPTPVPSLEPVTDSGR